MDLPAGRTTAADAVRAVLAARREYLLAVVRRRAGARVDAEEVVHAAFERALAKCGQLRDPSRAEAWVGRVVRNALLDELRRRCRWTLSVDDLDLANAAGDDRIDCWCVLAQAEQLKPEYAWMLQRVIVEGVSVTDVAAELGLTANNAAVRLHRARKALKDRLAAHCGTTSSGSCSDCGCMERGCCPQP